MDAVDWSLRRRRPDIRLRDALGPAYRGRASVYADREGEAPVGKGAHF